MALRPRWLSVLVLSNWELKALAFVLALMSFFAIQNEISFEAPYNIPITVIVDQPGIAILDQNPMTADVTFRGSEEDLRRLNQRQIKAIVRLKVTHPAGSERVPIGAQNIEGVSGVRVVSVQPATVTLTFDHEEEKQVAVSKPTVIGSPFLGKVEIDCEPQVVTIRGPKLRLAEVDSVSTEPVDVEGRVESFSKQLRVLPPSDTWISHIKPADVTVKVRIVTKTETRRFKDVPVLAIAPPGAPADVVFDPAVVEVALSGRAEVLEGIAADAIKVFVDCAKLNVTGTYELPVIVHLPGGIDVTTLVEPRTVKVAIGGQRQVLESGASAGDIVGY